MAKIIRSLAAVMVLLGVGLSLTLVVMLTTFHSVRANPGIIYVDRETPGSTHDGLSWTTAYTNVHAALAAAVSSDEIWVAEGVYTPGGAGERTATFTLENGVALYGGFAATETLRTERDPATNATILSGDIDDNDTNTDGNYIAETASDIQGANSYHVVTASGADSTAVLDGFVVTAGQAHGSSPNDLGGGMYNDPGSPTLSHVTFSGNSAAGYGGGMYTNSSSPTLTNASFSGNQAAWGGGMLNDDSNPTLTNVTFSSNTVSGDGGGMYNSYSSPTLTNVSFSGNQADRAGGMYNDKSSPTLVNVTFSGNTATYCGGMVNYSNSRPALTNVSFSGNTATNSGGGMCNGKTSSPTLTNVTFTGNSAYYGGGMSNDYYSSPTLTHVTFSGNTATNSGGGMLNGDSWTTLTNVTFSGNTATNSGGGMYNAGGSPTLTNVTFSGNAANNSGGGVYNIYSSPMLTNVILWGDSAPGGPEIYNDSSTPVIAYSDIQNSGGSGAGWDGSLGTDGDGNIDAAPLLVDAAHGDLHLQVNSPAIDAGDNTAVPGGITTDLDGNPRFVDIPTAPDTGNGTPPIVDMGAYETQQYVDVALGKAVAPPEAAPGQAITFTLSISNGGSITATHVVVTDTLPFLSGTSFTSTVVVTDTGHSPPYVWTVQDLAPGQSGVITVTSVLTVPLAAGTYTNTATIAADDDLWDDNNMVSVTFTVLNVAPAFTSTPVTTATQDVPYTYTATTEDANGDAVTITAPTLPGWLTLTDHGDGTATLSGTPTNAHVGDHAVVLEVTDSGGLYATQSFTITVVEKPWYRIYLPLALRNTP